MGSMALQGHAPSRRDRRLPYTYEAWVDILGGRGTEPVWDHYFSGTLCGLLEHLADREIAPANVRLFGVYRRDQRALDIALVTDEDGNWLQRPELCRVLEIRFARAHDECYRGHVARGVCAFADRDRRGSGPYW